MQENVSYHKLYKKYKIKPKYYIKLAQRFLRIKRARVCVFLRTLIVLIFHIQANLHCSIVLQLDFWHLRPYLLLFSAVLSSSQMAPKKMYTAFDLFFAHKNTFPLIFISKCLFFCSYCL